MQLVSLDSAERAGGQIQLAVPLERRGHRGGGWGGAVFSDASHSGVAPPTRASLIEMQMEVVSFEPGRWVNESIRQIVCGCSLMQCSSKLCLALASSSEKICGVYKVYLFIMYMLKMHTKPA